MDEIEAMKTISEKLEKLSEPERVRVMTWAVAKYASGQAMPTPAAQPTVVQQPAPKAQGAAKPIQKAKAGKKSKSIISMDKSLNLSPPGKQSGTDFAAEKAPTNAMQKCVVAVYYLRDFIGLEKVSVQAVFTFFKALGWPIPADLKNTLQKAGSEGWLDTADGEDIKLTSMGENVVEHDLPLKQ
jgi:hypothetical protein